MKSFFVTFGKGILYFLGLPFIITFIAGYGVYMLGVFFVMLFRTIVLYFQGKPTGIREDIDEKALLILKQRKLGLVKENLQQQITENTTENHYTQTINNYNIGMKPEDIQKLQEMQKQQLMNNQTDIPEIDTTVKKVDAIEMLDNDEPELPFEDEDKEDLE